MQHELVIPEVVMHGLQRPRYEVNPAYTTKNIGKSDIKLCIVQLK